MRSTCDDASKVSLKDGEEQIRAQPKRYSSSSKIVISFIFVGFLASTAALLWTIVHLSAGIY